jgi:tripartite-type tricarboxylate transporter receptor subunit TctC
MEPFVKMLNRLMACVLLLAAQCGVAQAAFPDKPVNLYVGFPPGTSVDIVARLMAEKLGQMWGQTIIVQNRVGAGGNIAAGQVVRAAPDGYSLLLGNNSVAISGSLYPNLAYKPLRDLTAISQLTSQPLVLVVKPTLPAASIKDLIALAKASPGKLNFGSGGVGNTDHLAGELFKSTAGIDIVHIPYKGGNQAMTDTIGGQVTMYFAGLAAALPLVQSNQLKALATTGARRSLSMPNVPTMAQSGLAGYEVDLWSGLMAPAATPKPIIDKIGADVDHVLKMPDVRAHFAALGLDVAYSPPSTFEAFFRAETQKWAQLIKARGISAQ